MSPPRDANKSFPPLDVACRDVRVFVFVSVGLGTGILGGGIYFAVGVATILGAVTAVAYFPFAMAYTLWQPMVSLRML